MNLRLSLSTNEVKCRIAQIEVFQEGSERIIPIRDFKAAGLHPVMLENTVLAGYVRPTPIQAYTLPTIFQNKDLIACAQTGLDAHISCL